MTVRTRKSGTRVVCPKCGGDMFVDGTRTVPNRSYPAHLGIVHRVRYYKCGDPQCAERLQRVAEDTR